MPAAGGEWAVVERGGESVPLPPRRRGGRPARRQLGAGGRARRAGGGGRSRAGSPATSYPDPLARVFSALAAPHSGDFVVSLEDGFEAVDWGGVTHAGGGSHGALHAGDSLGPLLFVGCGPESADEREQWALRDVAPVVLEHFGIARAAGVRDKGSCGRAGASVLGPLSLHSSPLAVVLLAFFALAPGDGARG